MRVAVLACVLVGLMPRQMVETPPSTQDPFCFRPLEEFCARKECWTHYGAEMQCRVTHVKLCKPL